MGKSPGNWIKAKLFGKKSTKLAISKKGEAGKEAFIVSKTSSGAVDTNEPLISDPQPVVTCRNGHNLAPGNLAVGKDPQETSTLLSESQEGGVKSTVPTSANKSDTLKKEQAVTKVQAALRGFLARRAFLAFKGIIRLQALIRGHLVRRQAVATLRCMQGVVKFQALIRGRKVRLSESGTEIKEKCNLENVKLTAVQTLISNRPVKLSRNAFAQKLLALSPNTIPLSLHYDSDDVNSAWNWLERWSSSHFWELAVGPEKDEGSKSSRKSNGNREVELENGRPKRINHRNPSTQHDNSSGKPKGAKKKYMSHQGGSSQENGQNELEKVKHNLRKVSLTNSGTIDRPDAVIEKPKSKVSTMREAVKPVVPELDCNNSAGKHSDPNESLAKEKHIEPNDTIVGDKGSTTLEPVIKVLETVITPPNVVEEMDEPSAEALTPSIQREEIPSVVDDLHTKEDHGKEKTSRRKSLSAKHEYPVNGSKNMPTLPSYMHATESAKAKLRALGSPRLSQDTTENGSLRRQSLPSLAGGKQNTPSPRIQKLVQGGSKGGIKSGKSLSASKDYSNEKVADWRR